MPCAAGLPCSVTLDLNALRYPHFVVRLRTLLAFSSSYHHILSLGLDLLPKTGAANTIVDTIMCSVLSCFGSSTVLFRSLRHSQAIHSRLHEDCVKTARHGKYHISPNNDSLDAPSGATACAPCAATLGGCPSANRGASPCIVVASLLPTAQFDVRFSVPSCLASGASVSLQMLRRRPKKLSNKYQAVVDRTFAQQQDENS